MQFIIGRKYLIVQGGFAGEVVTAYRESTNVLYFKDLFNSTLALDKPLFDQFVQPLERSNNSHPFNRVVGGI